MQPLVDIAYDAVNLLGLDSPVFPKIDDGLGCFANCVDFCKVEMLEVIPKM